jgi:hypothetical protein
MHTLPRRLGLFLASTAAVCGISVLVPATASAATTSTVSSVSVERPDRCRPAHSGRHWRWDDGRRRGHWDHQEWNRRSHRWEWKHNWRDDHYCAKRQDNDGRRHDR